jgi:hypothetical protein
MLVRRPRQFHRCHWTRTIEQWIISSPGDLVWAFPLCTSGLEFLTYFRCDPSASTGIDRAARFLLVDGAVANQIYMASSALLSFGASKTTRASARR